MNKILQLPTAIITTNEQIYTFCEAVKIWRDDIFLLLLSYKVAGGQDSTILWMFLTMFTNCK